MKIVCLSTQSREDLQDDQKQVQDYFGDKFRFAIRPKQINCVEDIHKLIRSNIISVNFTGGRKKFSALLNEMDCFVNHLDLLKTIIEPTIIYEDGRKFDISLFKKNTNFEDYDLIFCDKSWSMQNGKLVGFGTNYYVTPKAARVILNFTKHAENPYDLFVRNKLNEPEIGSQLKFTVAEFPFIERDPSVKHTIEDDNNVDVNNKQCFRPLFERLFVTKKPKFAIIASHPSLGTGYGNIATQIANHMTKHFDVIYLGFQSVSGAITNRYVNPAVKVYDLYAMDPESVGAFGDNAILPTLESEKPDVVFIYNDIGVISAIFKIIENYSCLKTTYIDMVYEFQDPDQVSFILNSADHVFTFCEFWKDYLDILYNKGHKVHNMYHGLLKHNLDKLTPRKDFGYKDDDFIVLNMNRNSNRKNLDISIRGFLLFLDALEKRGKNISKVYLQFNCHLCTKDGIHIPNVTNAEIIRHSFPKKYADQILVTTEGHSLTEDKVHSLYNACDIGLSTSSGEGFGLTVIEQALYNKQIVATFIPATRELIDTPYFVHPVDSSYDSGKIGGLMYRFRGEDVCEQLLKAYEAHELKRPVPCKINNMDQLDWTVICQKFYDVCF